MLFTFFNVDLQILPFSNAFYRGLTDLISPSWLKLFNASEFNQVFSLGGCIGYCFIRSYLAAGYSFV